MSAEGSGFRGITFSYNVRSQDRVDEVLAEASSAGATITKPAEQTPWGGYSGSFADPEGVVWEVATGATELHFLNSQSSSPMSIESQSSPLARRYCLTWRPSSTKPNLR